MPHRRIPALAAFGLTFAHAVVVGAQRPPRPKPTAPLTSPPPPAAAAAAAPAPSAPPSAASTPATAGPAPADENLLATPTDAFLAAPGGLTAAQAGKRAAGTSPDAQAAQSNAELQGALSDAAALAYVPRVTLSGRYTRLSQFTPPQLSPGVPAPQVLDLVTTQANVTVPLSDYLFRIGHTHRAANLAEESAQHETAAVRARLFGEGELAFYEWLRARGAVTVAEQAVRVARAHAKDADALFNNAKAFKADVLRAQTEVAGAELRVERAKAVVVQTERQLRVIMHAPASEALAPGESIVAPLGTVSLNTPALIAEALANRPELKVLEASAASSRNRASAQRAARLPTLSAFGNAYYSNPNPRKSFQAEAGFFPTWDVGGLVTWSPNDLALGGAGGAQFDAEARAKEGQRIKQRDLIEVEVVRAVQDVVQGDAAVQATKQQLASAIETYRVARELFVNGRTTGTTLIDAETSLEATRFDHLTAQVDARVARVKLDYAVGKNVALASAPPSGAP